MEHAFVHYTEMNDGFMRGYLVISDNPDDIKEVHDTLKNKILNNAVTNEYDFSDTKLTLEDAKERYPFMNDVKFLASIDEYINEVNENAEYHYSKENK